MLCVPRGAIRVLVDPRDYMDDAVKNVQNALGDKKIGFLIIGGHGDAGEVQIGKGLRLENAGEFRPLRDQFDTYRRVIKIYGCGVISDTPLRADPDLCKKIPLSCGVPMRGYWSPTFNPGKGYQMVKALANVTQAPVQAQVNVGENFYPDFFTFVGRSIYVYPDDAATEKRYTSDSGFLGLGDSYRVKHNDFCTIDYDASGNVIQGP